jgi:hypothetical protein
MADIVAAFISALSVGSAGDPSACAFARGLRDRICFQGSIAVRRSGGRLLAKEYARFQRRKPSGVIVPSCGARKYDPGW